MMVDESRLVLVVFLMKTDGRNTSAIIICWRHWFIML